MMEEALITADISAIVRVLNDGQAATAFFDDVDRQQITAPDLMLLDLNLPKKNGAEVLKHVRASVRSPHLPVVIVSSSDTQRDRDSVAQFGIAGYFKKASDYAAYMRLGDLVKRLLDESGTTES